MVIEATARGGAGALAPIFNRFLKWWAGELRALLPARLRAATTRQSRKVAIVVSGAGVRVFETSVSGDVRSDKAFPDDQAGFQAARVHLKSVSRSRLRACEVGIRFDNSVCFSRKFQIAGQAIAELPGITAVEQQRKTPFDSAKFCADYFVQPGEHDDGKVTVVQYFIKRPVLDDAVRTANELGIEPVFADVFAAEPGGVVPVNFLRSHDQAPTGGWTIGLLKGLAVILVVMLGAAAYVAIEREERALARLNAQIERTKANALEVRRTIEKTSKSAAQSTNLRLRKISTVSLIQLWEELTRVLPDSVWIIELQVKDRKAQITGFANSAASLIGILERSPYFSSVTFGSPVNTDPQLNKERFNIGFQLERLETQTSNGTAPAKVTQ